MSHAFSIIITIPLDTGGSCHHPSFVESYFYLVPDTLRGQILINVRVQWTTQHKVASSVHRGQNDEVSFRGA